MTDIDTANSMTPGELAAKIRENCSGPDWEANGCCLDGLIEEYFESHGEIELVRVIRNVKCWRS